MNQHWRAPRLWPNETVAIFAGGPTLTQDQVDRCRHLKTIAINNTYQLAPWADVLYACDGKWWKWHKGVMDFEGLRVSMGMNGQEPKPWFPGILMMRNAGTTGLEDEPDGLRTGRNGGYQAINLAVHLGAKRILLLGYDLRAINGKVHWHGQHPTPTQETVFDRVMLPHFKTLVQPLKECRVEVINCTPGSALADFPMMELEDALDVDLSGGTKDRLRVG